MLVHFQRLNVLSASKLTVPEDRAGKLELDNIEFKSAGWPAP